MIFRIFKKCVLFILVFQKLLFPLSADIAKDQLLEKAITYGQHEYRLGNQLITYLAASWIAHEYELPLLYVPFLYSDQFIFHEKEILYRSDFELSFNKTVFLKEVSEIPDLPTSTLIVVNFFHNDPRNPNNYKMSSNLFLNNPEFREYAKTMLQPRFPFQTIPLPEDKLNILVHVRTGGDFDSREMQLRFPNKFPPNSFFISAIETISKIFDHQLIYAYIMTDDLNPEKIVEHYSKALSHLNNIEIDCRHGKSESSDNVMEDFFSVPKFDCMIRGNSTFTIAASLLSNFKAVIIPKSSRVENGEVVVDQIDIILNLCPRAL